MKFRPWIILTAVTSLCSLLAIGRTSIINGESTDGYAAVRLLIAVADNGDQEFCTTQKIGRSTYLTAAHCVHAADRIAIPCQDRAGDDVPIASVRRVITHPIYTNDFAPLLGTMAGVDLAVLLVHEPQGCNVPILPVATRLPREGDRVKLVGYGATQFGVDPKIDGAKRVGNNRISSIDRVHGVIRLRGYSQNTPWAYWLGIIPYSAAGTRSGAGKGDSGGPLIQANSVVGIASQGRLSQVRAHGDETDVLISTYADLTTVSSRDFLRDAERQGAEIQYSGD